MLGDYLAEFGFKNHFGEVLLAEVAQLEMQMWPGGCLTGVAGEGDAVACGNCFTQVDFNLGKMGIKELNVA